MPFSKKPFAFALATLIAFSLAACDSGGSENDGPSLDDGTFEATARGHVTADLSGEALYGTVVEDEPQPDEPPEFFQIAMLADDEEDTTLVSFVRQTTEPLEEGVYDIIDGIEAERDEERPSEDAFAGFFGSQAEAGLFVSRSGTLEITRAESRQLEGTFAFEADEFLVLGPDPGSRSVSVEGAFSAARVDELTLPQSSAATRRLAW